MLCLRIERLPEGMTMPGRLPKTHVSSGVLYALNNKGTDYIRQKKLLPSLLPSLDDLKDGRVLLVDQGQTVIIVKDPYDLEIERDPVLTIVSVQEQRKKDLFLRDLIPCGGAPYVDLAKYVGDFYGKKCWYSNIWVVDEQSKEFFLGTSVSTIKRNVGPFVKISLKDGTVTHLFDSSWIRLVHQADFGFDELYTYLYHPRYYLRPAFRTSEPSHENAYQSELRRQLTNYEWSLRQAPVFPRINVGLDPSKYYEDFTRPVNVFFLGPRKRGPISTRRYGPRLADLVYGVGRKDDSFTLRLAYLTPGFGSHRACIRVLVYDKAQERPRVKRIFRLRNAVAPYDWWIDRSMRYVVTLDDNSKFGAGELVVGIYDGVTGHARVFSAGELFGAVAWYDKLTELTNSQFPQYDNTEWGPNYKRTFLQWRDWEANNVEIVGAEFNHRALLVKPPPEPTEGTQLYDLLWRNPEFQKKNAKTVSACAN